MSLGAEAARQRSDRPYVPLLIKYLSACCFGVLLGLIATFVVVEHGKGFGAVVGGPWTGWPRENSTSDIDPYTRAILAYSGKMPLSESEAMSFVAYGDSNGAQFDPACDYVMTGEVPSARYWTVALLSPSGVPLADRQERAGFTSSELLRTSDGQFEIKISRQARPGNWLPLGGVAKFILVLHIYDSELSAATGAISAATMPVITRGRCE
jgi:hypothetical protein